jgi:hypothetical protein
MLFYEISNLPKPPFWKCVPRFFSILFVQFISTSRWTLSPSLWYSITHARRSIGYRHSIPHPLVESTVRLMYLRVYDTRDSSCKPEPSPSLWYSLTHAHRCIGYHTTPSVWEVSISSTLKLMYLSVYDIRDVSKCVWYQRSFWCI